MWVVGRGCLCLCVVMNSRCVLEWTLRCVCVCVCASAEEERRSTIVADAADDGRLFLQTRRCLKSSARAAQHVRNPQQPHPFSSSTYLLALQTGTQTLESAR